MKKITLILLFAVCAASCSSGGTSPREYEPALRPAARAQPPIAHRNTCALVPATTSGSSNSSARHDTAGASLHDAWTSAGPGKNGIVPDLYHFVGGLWQQAVVPALNGSSNWNGAQLGPIAPVSDHDVWIAGAGIFQAGDVRVSASPQGGVVPQSPPPRSSYPFMLHWGGTSLKVVNQPPSTPTDVGLGFMAAVAPNDVWATGSRTSQHPRRTYVAVMHWDGTRWASVANPADEQSNATDTGLAAVARNDVEFGVSPVDSAPYIARWNGSAFIREPLPAEEGHTVGVQGIADVEGSRDAGVWVLGYLQGASAPYLAHRRGPSWQTFYLSNLPATAVFNILAIIRNNYVLAFGSDAFGHNYVLSYNGSLWSLMQDVFPAGDTALTAAPVTGTTDVWMTVNSPASTGPKLSTFAELLHCRSNQ